jgi:diadenosine tetraphosphate (Ap4A) HIT family hydrolase
VNWKKSSPLVRPGLGQTSDGIGTSDGCLGRLRDGDTERMTDDECLLCRVGDADEYFHRRRVWADEHWRLSIVLHGAVVGFAHLEPHRHIPFVTDLDGPEAATLGPVLARVTAALRQTTAADKVYVYVFGDRVPYLHFNLTPHRPGDALVGGPGLLRPDAIPADLAEHEAAATAIGQALAERRHDIR